MDKKEYDKQRYIRLKNNYISRNKQYRNTPMGRASNQINQYKRMDNRNGFGNTIDFDAKWMIENIYTKPCTHCGETDWQKLGCNRLDNSKPHTKNNVESCCKKCNDKLASLSRQKKVDQINIKTGEVIASFTSTKEAAELLSFGESNINRCCKGGYYQKGKWINCSQAYGYFWKRY